MTTHLLGIDQGTSGSRALIIDREGQTRGYAHVPLARLYPQPDRVEQDPETVAIGVKQAITAALRQANLTPGDIAACGLACQRNSDFVWDSVTGQPLANAITWQDLRTLPLLRELEAWPLFGEARYRLGYPPAPYMSALHLGWRMAHDTAVQEAARNGRLRIGQSAAWLIQRLGQPSGHLTDRSLAQATGLYDIRHGRYWPEWRERLNIPLDALPQAAPTLRDFGHLQLGGQTIPVLATIGDQQAALFGHGGWRPGDLEITHGTGSYVKLFVGETTSAPETVDLLYAWDIGQGQTYCLEAQTTVSGAALRWLRDELSLFADYSEIDALARSVSDSGEVVFVPAFTGLNVPYNNRRARATLLGLTLGAGRGHIMRAFLDALGFQVRAILQAVQTAADLPPQQILVGGGITASDVACQIQADLTGLPVKRPTFTETGAYGAALLAGLGAGFWCSLEELPPQPGSFTLFEPTTTAAERDAAFAKWETAVRLVEQYAGESKK
jgi:glycerol kinase